MHAAVTSTSRCWLPAPSAANPRPFTSAGPLRPCLAQHRAASLYVTASSSNGTGPSLNGATAVDPNKQRPSRHDFAPSSMPKSGTLPTVGDAAEDGGWLETAAARLAAANGGNLYATSPPPADRRQHGQSAAVGAADGVAQPADQKSSNVAAGPRGDAAGAAAARGSAQPDAGAGRGGSRSPAGVTAAEAPSADGGTDGAQPLVSVGQVQPWGRTIAQALAAGEQTRRRHDEASAR